MHSISRSSPSSSLATLGACFWVCALALAAPGQQPVPGADPVLPADRRSGADTISVEDLTRWLTTLSSDEFGGRATGTDEFAMAADFVKEHFEKWGVEPGAADGTYFQVVSWERVAVDRDKTHLTVRADDETVLTLRDGAGLSGRASVNSEGAGPLTLLVVGDLQESGIDDMDLNGRVVLLAEGAGAAARLDPRRRRFASTMLATNGARALQGGANAVFVVGGAESSDSDGIEEVRRAGGRNRALRGRGRMPNTLQIPLSRARELLRRAGLDENLVGAADGDGPQDGVGTTTRHDLVGLTATTEVVVESTQAPAWNVVGIIPGSDPELKDEYVVIGSHLDHIGQSATSINNGADDDGSGSVGLMAIARAFAKNEVRPRRSVLLVAFCAEENGLVGSAFFANDPPAPLSAMVAELQLDMIGRNEEKRGERAEDNLNCLHLVGTEKLSRDLHTLCMAKNEVHGFALEFDEESVFSRSDHANFAAKGIPIAFFFTGFHPDYHRPTDTVDKIDFPKLRRVVLYVYDIAFDLAQADARPMVDESLWRANRGKLRRAVETPAAPVRKDG